MNNKYSHCLRQVVAYFVPHLPCLIHAVFLAFQRSQITLLTYKVWIFAHWNGIMLLLAAFFKITTHIPDSFHLFFCRLYFLRRMVFPTLSYIYYGLMVVQKINSIAVVKTICLCFREFVLATCHSCGK